MRLFASVILMLCALSAHAQPVAGLGGISGVVRDASGAVVPGAQVVVANESRGIRRTLESNEAGVFAAPALAPSAGYTITVNKQGFAAFEAKGIEVLVGQNVNINAVLQVATTTLQIEVTEAAPIVEQTKTGVSQVVTSDQIQNLPINGRRVDSFVLFSPGVVPDGTFGLLSFRGIAGGNAFLTDGNDTTQQFFNENAGRTRISSQISQDAVQEFQVLSSGFSAEFGRASGGVVNTVTRSGSNELHGTGYWFFRNQDFAARDRYAASVPEETRHQAGASVGGPIARDKLFYFFNGDVTRRSHPLVALINRPPLFDSTGKFTGNCTATAAQCEAARRYIMDRHFGTLDRTSNQDLVFGKLDWRPTERHAISGSLNYLRWVSPNGIQTGAAVTSGSALSSNGDATVNTRYGRLAWTAVPANNKVNELRFGWMRDRQFDDLPARLVPKETGLLELSVEGISVGVANYLPRLNPSENRYQVADNFYWTVGRHAVKFGFDFANTADVTDSMITRAGSYRYATFTAFAQDFSGNTTGAKRWQTYAQAFGNPRAEHTIRDYSFYVQDQFRVTGNLTVNYGLRYEYAQITQPGTVNPNYRQTGRIPQPGRNFAPRIGLAYAFSDNRTVVRGGYGVFYARIQGGLVNNFHIQNGVYRKSISLDASRTAELAAGPVFPNNLGSIDREPPAGSVSIMFAADDYATPYTQQADIGIERQITANLGLTASYIWSRGVHMTTVRDLNIGPLGAPVTYRILDASANQVDAYTTPTYRLANRIDPRWQRINQVDSGGNSYYNAMVVQLRKRLSRGVEASLAYTWSHAIDNNQGGGSDNIFFTAPRSLFNGDYQGDKSSSSLDQRHRLAATTILSPRFTKSDSGLARYLINNWQLAQITVLASTFPATPFVRVSGTPFTGAAFTGTLNGFGGSSRAPFIPAASMDVDQIYRTDARLSKVLPFSERFRLYLSFEAFNLFNHVSNTAVNGEAYSASGGALRPTAGFGVGNTSGGFPDGTNARRAQVSLRLVF
ncbi:MAG: TonB-dependent receptor [Acidobacteriota bacterium]